MTATRLVLDAKTGESVQVPLTAQELADAAQEAAAVSAAMATYKSTSMYLDQRKQAIYQILPDLLSMLWNDLSAGTALNAGTFYSAIATINKQYPAPNA